LNSIDAILTRVNFISHIDRLKNGIEMLEEKHPNRTDLIRANLTGLNSCVDMLGYVKSIEAAISVKNSRNSDLEIALIKQQMKINELEAELNKLKQILLYD
jgi:predicted RNase H-like nuclease (RuvC/YqgF family)